MELSRVFGYRAEVVLYDRRQRALHVENAIRIVGVPGRVEVDTEAMHRALTEARSAGAFDPVQPTSLGNGWRVEVE